MLHPSRVEGGPPTALIVLSQLQVVSTDGRRPERATGLGAAQVWTLRERLLKVAVWVERSVRRIVLHLPQVFPWRDPWRQLAQALTAT